ncbi:MAG: diacylglycerol kinase [Bdellovibrionia bacterium]
MKGQNFFFRFVYAMQGLRTAWKSELSFRVEIGAGLGAFGLLVTFRPAPIWWAVVAIMSGAVLAAELVNTALEKTLDKLHPEQDPLVGQAKDCAAAAVFVLCLMALVVLGSLLLEVL